MRVTEDWIRKYSQRGAMTEAQLALLGIGWTPPAGWKQAVLSTDYPENVILDVQDLAKIRDKEVKKERERIRKYDEKHGGEVYYTWPEGESWAGSSEKPEWWDKCRSWER